MYPSVKNRKAIYFDEPLWELQKDTPKGELSERVNTIVDRYRLLIKMTQIELTEQEKLLMGNIFSGSVLQGQNLQLILRHMPTMLEDSGLSANEGYSALLAKVEAASILERLLMLEAAGF